MRAVATCKLMLKLTKEPAEILRWLSCAPLLRSWCLASGLGREEDRDILPVMTFHAPFFCELLIEKSATITRK